MVGVLVVGVLAQHRLVGCRGSGEVAKLKAGVAEVVAGVVLRGRTVYAAEGVAASWNRPDLYRDTPRR